MDKNKEVNLSAKQSSEFIIPRAKTPTALASAQAALSQATSTKASVHGSPRSAPQSPLVDRARIRSEEVILQLREVTDYLDGWVNADLNEVSARKRIRDAVLAFLSNPNLKMDTLILTGNFSKLPDIFQFKLIE